MIFDNVILSFLCVHYVHMNMCMPCRIPVQTIFEAHSDGCAAITMSPDAKYIATVSSTLPQVH